MTASKPMAYLSTLSEAEREAFMQKKDRLVVVDGGLQSPFFSITPGIIINGEGKPLYDRPLIREEGGVMVVQWGKAKDGTVRIGLIRQKRPPADDPHGAENHAPLVFGQVVMGYREGDSIVGAAMKEKVEESGHCKVLNTEVIDFPWFNIEPNTYANWEPVVFMEVDLATVDHDFTDSKEMIGSVVWITIPELLRCIKEGRDETGAYFRGGSSLAPLMIFFAAKPELFVQAMQPARKGWWQR